MDFFDKDYAGYSEITRSKIDKASNEQLKALLALESDDLRETDIQFIKDELRARGESLTSSTSNYTGLDNLMATQHMRTKTIDLKAATQDNTEYKGPFGKAYGGSNGSNNIMLNQGDNYVSKQENISIEKKVRHFDNVPHILSRYQFN